MLYDLQGLQSRLVTIAVATTTSEARSCRLCVEEGSVEIQERSWSPPYLVSLYSSDAIICHELHYVMRCPKERVLVSKDDHTQRTTTMQLEREHCGLIYSFKAYIYLFIYL